MSTMDPGPDPTADTSSEGSLLSEPDRPLPRRGWDDRDRESVVPENFVEDDRTVEAAALTWPTDVGALKPGAMRILLPEQVFDEGGLRRLPMEADDRALVQQRWPIPLELRLDPPTSPPAPPSGDGGGDDEPPIGMVVEQRHLRGEAPESVLPGRRFAVAVQVACGKAHGTAYATDLVAFGIAETGREVAIDLHVHGGLRILSDATCTLMVRPGVDSSFARFELEAVAVGPATITLRAFALPSDFIGQLRFDVPVSPAATGIAQSLVSSTVDLRSAPGRNATLEVDLDGDMGAPVLSFRLRGPGAIGVQPRHATPLRQSLTDIALGLERQLDQLAKGTNWSNRAVEAILAGTGASLWQDLLPDSVQRMLLAHLDRIDSLTVIGADDPVPWELMMPVVPGKRNAFLGDRVLITRWAYGAAAAPLRLGTGTSRCFVLPDSAPPAARTEIDLLEQTLGQGRRIGTLDQLLDLLDAPDFGVLHFAAHNIVASGLPASAWVKLDQPFQQSMLGPTYTDTFAPNAPLVFMNACNSGAASPLWVGSTSWAGRFLQAGAGAFIGSLWQVRDGPAKDFAHCFYDHLAKGLTLGEAFQSARGVVARAGDPTRLGYVLFGNPDARLNDMPGRQP